MSNKAAGAIFQEMDLLTDKIVARIGKEADEHGVKELIRAELDDWVKKRVVRFHCDFPAHEVEGYEIEEGAVVPPKIHAGDEFFSKCSWDMMEMCGLYEPDGKEVTVTMYLMAFKENF